jgi:ABC-type transport system involved in multi-copper enzyme maturation permease subunit
MPIKDLFLQLKYNFKILSSNKYILCIIFYLIIPYALNLENQTLVYLIFELYAPLIGIILFADMISIESNYRTEEVFYMTKVNKIYIVILRAIINILFLLCLSALTFLTLNFRYSISGGNQFLFYLSVLKVSLPTTIFFGLLGMTISNASKNSIIGYMLSFTYWVYWLANLESKSILNPFSYVAGITEPMINKYLLMLISLILLLLNIHPVNQSPFNNKFGTAFKIAFKKNTKM